MHLLLDLDGTLTDPFDGITRCIQHAFYELNLPVPEADQLGWCIGPPLKESFIVLLGKENAALADTALQHYRDRFRDIGYAENRLYPEIEDTLLELTKSGHSLHLATAKPEVFARPILSHFSLCKHFHSINGSLLNGMRTDKRDLLAYILSEQGILPGEAVMIGDREHDVIGAKANGVKAVGALWGYGSHDELTQAGANLCISSPREILHIVTP